MDDLSIEKAVSRASRVRGTGTRMGYNLFLEENLVGSHTTESSPCGYGHPPAWPRGNGLESAVPREPAGAFRPAGTILPVPFPERAIGGCGKGTCRPSGARRRRQGTPGRAQPGGDRHREDAGGGSFTERGPVGAHRLPHPGKRGRRGASFDPPGPESHRSGCLGRNRAKAALRACRPGNPRGRGHPPSRSRPSDRFAATARRMDPGTGDPCRRRPGNPVARVALRDALFEKGRRQPRRLLQRGVIGSPSQMTDEEETER